MNHFLDFENIFFTSSRIMRRAWHWFEAGYNETKQPYHSTKCISLYFLIHRKYTIWNLSEEWWADKLCDTSRRREQPKVWVFVFVYVFVFVFFCFCLRVCLCLFLFVCLCLPWWRGRNPTISPRRREQTPATSSGNSRSFEKWSSSRLSSRSRCGNIRNKCFTLPKRTWRSWRPRWGTGGPGWGTWSGEPAPDEISQ